MVTPVAMEPLLGYHPCSTGFLTSSRDPAGGQCQVGSLTGAGASDPLSEATAPVKLPVWHCPTAGSRRLVRNPILQGWYPNSGSMATGVTIS